MSKNTIGMNRPERSWVSARQLSSLNDRAHQLKIHPEGCSAGVVRGLVGAVDGGVRATGDCVGIEDRSLVEVPVKSGSCEEVVL